MKTRFTAVMILSAMLFTACNSGNRSTDNTAAETEQTGTTSQTAATASETETEVPETTTTTTTTTTVRTTAAATETPFSEMSFDGRAARFLGSDECLSLEWEFGTFIDINDKPHKEIILWHEDALGNLMGTVFDISGDAPENIGTFAADIGSDGSYLIPASRLHQTKELYFTPLIKTENGCRLMRYPFSEDGIMEGEIIAEFDGDINGNRQKAAEYLTDYWNTYTSHIDVKRDFERDEAAANPYSVIKNGSFTDYYSSAVNYCYFHADYLLLPETIRTNGISVHMREEDVLAALGTPDNERDCGVSDDGYMKIFYYGDDWVELFLDEPSGIWLVDSYGFSEFTTSIGISSGMTRQELLASEIGDRLHIDHYGYIDDDTTVENADVLTTGEYKYGELCFLFDGDIISGIGANNGTSI